MIFVEHEVYILGKCINFKTMATHLKEIIHRFFFISTTLKTLVGVKDVLTEIGMRLCLDSCLELFTLKIGPRIYYLLKHCIFLQVIQDNI